MEAVTGTPLRPMHATTSAACVRAPARASILSITQQLPGPGGLCTARQALLHLIHRTLRKGDRVGAPEIDQQRPTKLWRCLGGSMTGMHEKTHVFCTSTTLMESRNDDV